MLSGILPVHFVLSFAFFRYEMQIVSECGCLFEPERRVGTGTFANRIYAVHRNRSCFSGIMPAGSYARGRSPVPLYQMPMICCISRLTKVMPIQQHAPNKIGLPPVLISLITLLFNPIAAIAMIMKNLDSQNRYNFFVILCFVIWYVFHL